MTLVLSCLTDDCAYQVSDRRLTSFDPPRAPIDDETNKALFVNGRVAFAYAGISKVNGEPTDLWLTRVAASVNSTDIGAISKAIRDEATSAFRRMSFASRYKRHAFQGAGWFSDPSGGALRPGIITIHNALESGTGDWLPYARPTFDLAADFPKVGRAQFYLASVGLTPTRSEKSEIYRYVRKCVHRTHRRQEIILTALVASMRWLHDRYQPNSPIGANLMAVSVPKAAATRAGETNNYVFLAGEPSEDTATFLDVNVAGRTTVFGPNLVHRGSAVSGFSGGPFIREQPSAA